MKDFKNYSGQFKGDIESRRSFIKKTGSMIAFASLAGPLDVFAQENSIHQDDVPKNIMTKGYAARSEDGILSPYESERRALRDDDVQIEILYCGVCHSDIHTVRGHWGKAHYPLVPGHEIAGKVVAVGKNVTRFKAGNKAGVGCMVNSCGTCDNCKDGLEQYCEKETTWTYDSPDRILGGYTQGGYSKTIVVKEHFVISIPDSMDLSLAAPLLCSGITTYSPIMAWKIKEGMHVGVAGIGGLGHVAIKLAVSKGAKVTAFTTTPSKADDIKRFGAEEVVLVDDTKSLRSYFGSLDYLISTIPQNYDINSYIRLVKRNGTFTQVGVPGDKYSLNPMTLVGSGVNINGSLIGGIPETQEVINYCAANKISPEIRMINIEDVSDAYNKVVNKEARYRYVIDMSKFL